MWWSTTCIRSPTWWNCPLQGQYSYMISLLIRRLTFVDTSSISWPRVLKRGTPKLSCHSPSHYRPHCKDMAQTSERSHHSTKRLSHWCTHSDSKHNSHQRIQNRCASNTKEEIKRFTSTPESSAQPSSQAQAWGPDRLDRLIARVEQMYTMLDSHL